MKIMKHIGVLLFMINHDFGLTNKNSNSPKGSYSNFINNTSNTFPDINDNLKCGIYDNSEFLLPHFQNECYNDLQSQFNSQTQPKIDNIINEHIPNLSNKNEESNENIVNQVIDDDILKPFDIINSGSMTLDNTFVFNNFNICKLYENGLIEEKKVDFCSIDSFNFENKNNNSNIIINNYIENKMKMDNIIDDIIDSKIVEMEEVTESSYDPIHNNVQETEIVDNLNELINEEIDTKEESRIYAKLDNHNQNDKINSKSSDNISKNQEIIDDIHSNNTDDIQEMKNLADKKSEPLIVKLLSNFFSFNINNKKENGEINIKEDNINPIFPTKDFSLTGKERPNYASSDCAAILLKSNKEAKYANSILNEKKDSYMINECSAKNKFVIIELCNDILIDAIVIGNFELFSSTTKLFKVSVANKFNYHNNKWTTLSYFQAANLRDLQVFKVENPVMYARYVRIDFISNYGFESFCPLSILRIHGITMMEEYKADEYPEINIKDDDSTGEENDSINNNISDSEEKSLSEENKQQINFHLDYLRSKSKKSQNVSGTDITPLNNSLDSIFRRYFVDVTDTSDINGLQESNEGSFINNENNNNNVIVNQPHTINTNTNNRNNGNIPNGHTQQPVQENIYKTIMRRLTILETNSTASLIYLQEQNKMLDHYFNIIQRLQNLLPLESLTDENIGIASASAVENLQIYLEGVIKEMKKVYSKKIFDISIEMLRDKKLYMEKLNNASERIEKLEKSRNFQFLSLIIIILFSSRVTQIINALHSLIFDSSIPFSQKLKKNNSFVNQERQTGQNSESIPTITYNTASALDKRPLLEDIDNYSMSGFSFFDGDEEEIESEVIYGSKKSNVSLSINSVPINNYSSYSNSSKRTHSKKQEYVRIPKNQPGKSIPDINIYKNYNNYYSEDPNYLSHLENIQKRNSLTDLDLLSAYNNNNMSNTESEDERLSIKSNYTSSKQSILAPLTPLSPLSISSNHSLSSNYSNNSANNNNNNNNNNTNNKNNSDNNKNRNNNNNKNKNNNKNNNNGSNYNNNSNNNDNDNNNKNKGRNNNSDISKSNHSHSNSQLEHSTSRSTLVKSLSSSSIHSMHNNHNKKSKQNKTTSRNNSIYSDYSSLSGKSNKEKISLTRSSSSSSTTLI